ncbi:MAG: flagellar basal body-associated FliL family protein [Planctomycetes bacterium]|nr:flagellar basal body-associated FliL family protein [Planctomycetota bacterium]
MKIKLIIGVAFVAIIAVAAFVVAGGGTKLNAAELEKMRGTEGYYAEQEMLSFADPMGPLPPELIATCADAPKVIKFAFDVQYRLGKEWAETPEMATEAFTKKMVEVRSNMILMIASKTSSEITGGSAVAFLEEVRRTLNEVVFPKKMARVERVLIKQMFVQGL